MLRFFFKRRRFPPSNKHPRQKKKRRGWKEEGTNRDKRGASQFSHGDNRNNGFAYHRIYPLRLYIAALRGGGAEEERCASSMSCKHT